jgi:hypothetical protein
MPIVNQAKRARAALGGPSLAHPSQLVPPAPPNAGLSVGKQPKKGGRNVNEWVKAQFKQQKKAGGKVGEVEHKCKHCSKVMSGTNVTRLKEHVLNGTVCKFLGSTAAEEVAKVVPEVMTALQAYKPKASGSGRWMPSSHPMFQVSLARLCARCSGGCR